MAGRQETPSEINQCSLLASATERELKVAGILLELRFLMDIVENLPGPNWGRRKMRSSVAAAAVAAARLHSSGKSPVKAMKKESTPAAAAPAETTSPVTPLAFQPSESDEILKAQRSSKKPSKKKPKDMIAMVEELIQNRDLLRKEVQNVAKYYNQLQAENSKLKAIRQEVRNSCPMKEEPVSVKQRIAGVTLGAESVALCHQIGVPHLQPLVADRTAESMQPLSGPIAAAQLGLTNGSGPKSSGLNFDLNMVPDLNISADDMVMVEASQPFNQEADRVARSAEARRKRKEMMRSKGSVSGDDVAFGEASQPLDLADRRARSAEARRRRKWIINNIKAMKYAAAAAAADAKILTS